MDPIMFYYIDVIIKTFKEFLRQRKFLSIAMHRFVKQNSQIFFVRFFKVT